MKKDKIIFWIATGLIVIFEGVLPALTGHSDMAIEGITHLGYPLYFVTILTVFKVLGAIILAIPKFPKRLKEWAYAGFTFDFVCAFISLWVVDGFNGALALPIVALAILAVSYIYYHKVSYGANSENQ